MRSRMILATMLVTTGCASAVGPDGGARDDAAVARDAPDVRDARGDDGRPRTCGEPVVPLSLPSGVCGGRCLVLWREAATPTILYDDAMHPDQRLHYMVTVTDAFAVVVAMSSSVPGAPRTLLAFPAAGGAPVVVDSFDGSVENPAIVASATDGATLLYYALETGPIGARSMSLRRWDSQVGGQARVLTTLASRAGAIVATPGGTVYVSDVAGIARVPREGGPAERVVEATNVSAMTFSSGAVAWIERGTLLHMLRFAPLSAPGPARTLLTLQAGTDRMGTVAFAPAGDALLLAHETGISRVPLDAGAPLRVHTAPIEMALDIPLRVEGTRVWFSEACAPAVPDGQALLLPRELDLATGAARWLSDDPRYPYVPHFPRMIVQTIEGLNSNELLWSATSGFYSLPPGR